MEVTSVCVSFTTYCSAFLFTKKGQFTFSLNYLFWFSKLPTKKSKTKVFLRAQAVGRLDSRMVTVFAKLAQLLNWNAKAIKHHGLIATCHTHGLFLGPVQYALCQKISCLHQCEIVLYKECSTETVFTNKNFINIE